MGAGEQVPLKRNRAYSVAFRATVGKEASELADSKKDSYLSDLVRKHFEYEQTVWRTEMTEDEKKKHRQQQSGIEPIRKLIAGWGKSRGSGNPKRP